MTWTKLDDTFHGHPKIMRVGLEATGLHVVALSYCSWALTNGRVTPEFVEQKAGRRGRTLVAKLVDAGLWTENGDGWEIHDYLAFNPSRAEILERRRADSARKAAGRG